MSKNLDDKREWREGLTDAEARIERLETETALMLEDSIEAKHHIEQLETALAAKKRSHDRDIEQLELRITRLEDDLRNLN